MPYPSPAVLAAAATDLAGSHPLTIITIPALLRAARVAGEIGRLPTIERFGTAQERPVLEAFRLRDDTPRPYLAVWQSPPSFIKNDYPGSTLQRLRTQDLLGQELFNISWDQAHTKRIGTALRPNAGAALEARGIQPVNRLSLALWLARDQAFDSLDEFLTWFALAYPFDGTDLQDFYRVDSPAYADVYTGDAWGQADAADNAHLLAEIGPIDDHAETLDVPSTTPPRTTGSDEDASDEHDLAWTRDFCAYPLRDADIARIVDVVLAKLDEQRIVLPDAEELVRRSVAALLVGHLILQGPPGTGKTTLARILAEAFSVRLLESTATSEWSPFHVVGGLRPGADNTLKPSYGKVSDAALKCAVHVRADVNAEAGGDEDARERPQGTWLLIDEFNRADIDKAIGSLYTMLSSCDAANLERSPIDLWFESEGRQQLWVPSRFRIIAAMNDLDSSFVNPISQGLTRRFQFITVGTPPVPDGSLSPAPELVQALRTAHQWLSATYGGVLSISPVESTASHLSAEVQALQDVVFGLRTKTDTAPGWPLGTAQIVDVFRTLLLQVVGGAVPRAALDLAVADRMVPQMGQLDEAQLTHAGELFNQATLPRARAALQHLIDPHST